MKNRSNDTIRIAITALILFSLLLIYTLRLANLQLANGQFYLNEQQKGDSKVQIVESSRGEITDRNGEPFAYNATKYAVFIDKAFIQSGKTNENIAYILTFLKNKNESFNYVLPIKYSEDGILYLDNNEEASINRLNKYLEIDEKKSAKEYLDILSDRYNLSSYESNLALEIASVRYDMDRKGFSLENRYEIAEDISKETAILLLQSRNNYPAIVAEEIASREYIDGDLAPHIIGRVGSIPSDELSSYLEKGYSSEEKIGLEGIEKAFEDQLRGTVGEKVIYRDHDYNIIDVVETKEALAGDTIMLSIDKNLQRVAKDALVEEIKYLNENAPEGEGKEANAGAVVVIDIKQSEVLAAVSYPSYDVSTYSEDFEENVSNPLNPLWNRAMVGIYAPGSIFKPTVAIAGLTEGVITSKTKVDCERTYTYYDDYQPTCLSAHGFITVAEALKMSCNIFFYDTGRQLGIEKINKYARSLGLGMTTGIEIKEGKGTQCDPDSTNPGDTLQAAIGQLDNGYTPIQLANYAATIARKGKRTKLSLVHEIKSYSEQETVNYKQEEVYGYVDVDDSTWDTIYKGMIDATHDIRGTSYRYLGDYPIKIASKTGTPQRADFPNSTFICFAPVEDPQIAIAVVIEKGWHGYTGAPVARKVFDAYFFPDGNLNNITETATDLIVN